MQAFNVGETRLRNSIIVTLALALLSDNDHVVLALETQRPMPFQKPTEQHIV